MSFLLSWHKTALLFLSLVAIVALTSHFDQNSEVELKSDPTIDIKTVTKKVLEQNAAALKAHRKAKLLHSLVTRLSSEIKKSKVQLNAAKAGILKQKKRIAEMKANEKIEYKKELASVHAAIGHDEVLEENADAKIYDLDHKVARMQRQYDMLRGEQRHAVSELKVVEKHQPFSSLDVTKNMDPNLKVALAFSARQQDKKLKAAQANVAYYNAKEQKLKSEMANDDTLSIKYRADDEKAADDAVAQRGKLTTLKQQAKKKEAAVMKVIDAEKKKLHALREARASLVGSELLTQSTTSVDSLDELIKQGNGAHQVKDLVSGV